MLNRLSQIGLVLCLATAIACPQKKKEVPPQTPKPAPIVQLDVEDHSIPGVPAGIPVYRRPSPTPTPSKPDSKVKVQPPTAPRTPRYTPPPRPPYGAPEPDGVTSEKVIAADPGVKVQLCVSDGDVKINGSEKNEVRVFVRNGRKFEFSAYEKNPDSGKANWVQLARATAGRPAVGQFGNCLAGESVEIDMPTRGELVLSGRSASVTVDTVTKVTIKLLEGDVSVRNVSGGLYARTEQGDLNAESIGGEVGLETTSGNIVAFDMKGARPGDPLRVNTIRGTISLQKIGHRQIEANATSGSLKYVGTFEGGGNYRFRSASGRIGLLLPADVNCRVSATYGFGNFDSAFPLKIVTENVVPGGKVIVADLGKGNAPLVNLSTTSGSIRIVKQGEIEIP